MDLKNRVDDFVACINRVNCNAIYMVPPELLKISVGLTGEAAEVMDILKEAMYYNKEIDYNHLQEELGDIMYFVTLGLMLIQKERVRLDLDDDIEELSIQELLDETMSKIVAKLDKRYPNGFNTGRAQMHNRDLETEKKVMSEVGRIKAAGMQQQKG